MGAALDFGRTRNAKDYAIATPGGIDEAKYLKVGGIDQWVTIRGEDRANPAVLVLHGGPGDATNPWGYAGFRSWLKSYTVVQWDQRGTGKTLGRNGRASAETLTIDRLVQDGVELAEALRTSLRKDKIVLLGHSWGSVLGVLMAKKRPDLFQAFVGTGQVDNPAGGYDVAFAALLAKARALSDARALRGTRRGGSAALQGRARLSGASGDGRTSSKGPTPSSRPCSGSRSPHPGTRYADVNDWLDGQNLSAERLVPQERALAPTAFRGRFDLPVFVIQGAEDFTTPTDLARAFVDRIDAPHKRFVTIKGGHFAVFMNSSEFMREIGALLDTTTR